MTLNTVYENFIRQFGVVDSNNRKQKQPKKKFELMLELTHLLQERNRMEERCMSEESKKDANIFEVRDDRNYL